MTHVILFHHAQGLTDGVAEFAQRLRDAGHEVVVPDLYEGRTFDTIDAGVANAESIGFDTIIERGRAAAEALPANTVYAGFSLGTLPAQKLAQSRAGALGALLYHGGVPAAMFGSAWPAPAALQMHVSEGDDWVELDEVEELAGDAGQAELFIYPGSGHLVADPSLGEYDEDIAELILERSIQFLDRLA
ncbi:dienelactone hydrolase family protein [Cryobacterium sp. SO2]|uniref:dienelactone hydrolase family protein n=1 Tax=Cryobacterium sp. SO2 TaxID=1897060 RepID=UPI00223CA63B|nr:dienelactone hydrolase family protein [Cryobacterium sp. SO2]WEO77600.1 dienelactone hydrolase family protein [Cryobacterium sp. SO2]